MRFLPALRRAQPDVPGPAETKLFLGDYYAGADALGIVTGAGRRWDVERAVTEAYEKVVWAFAAVEAISTSSSRLPFQVRKGDTVEDDHPLYRVLNRRANPLETGRQFRKRLSAQVLLSRRGAFVEVTSSRAGTPLRMDLLPPARTWPVPGDGSVLLSHFELRDVLGRVTREVDPARVRWVREPHPTDPYSGITPLDAAGLSVDLDHQARRYNVTFLTNDGRPGQLILVKGDADDLILKGLEAKLNPGPQHAGKTTVITGDGLEAAAGATAPRDMQYQAVSRNAKTEILVAFGVPESVLGNAADKTFSNADAEGFAFWTLTMAPHNDLIAASFEADLEEGFEGFLDTASVEVLRRTEQARREEARAEVAAGLRTIHSYAQLAGLDEIADTPQTRALWVPGGKQPVPSTQADTDAQAAALQAGPGGPGGGPPPEGPPPAEGAPPPEAGPPPDQPGPAGPDTPPPPGGPAPPGPEPAPTSAPQGDAPVDDTITLGAPDDPASGLLGELKRMLAPAPPRVRLIRKAIEPLAPDTWAPGRADAAQAAAALSAALTALTVRWVERAIARLAGPKARKGTRHWTASDQYADDGRAGVKALDPAAGGVDPDRWSTEAQDTARPILDPAATASAAAAAGWLAAGSDDDGGAAATAAVAAALAALGASAARQALSVAGLINGMDQAGDDIDAIAAALRDVATKALGKWATTAAAQSAEAAVHGAAHAIMTALAGADPSGAAAGRIVRTWVTEHDDNVRPTHAAADGQQRRLGEPFTVGDALLAYPGDPAGPPEETIGCRCQLAWSTVRGGAKAAPGLTHGVSGPGSVSWDEGLHPRDHNGRFINKFAIVTALLPTGWVRGTVIGNHRNKATGHVDVDVHATDGRTLKLAGSQITLTGQVDHAAAAAAGEAHRLPAPGKPEPAHPAAAAPGHAGKGPRFANLDAVRAHLNAGGDSAGRAVTAAAARKLAGDNTLTLSPGRRLVAREVADNQWAIFNTGGVRIGTADAPILQPDMRGFAVRKMRALESDPRLRDAAGDPLPWDDPNIGVLLGSWKPAGGRALKDVVREVSAEHTASERRGPAEAKPAAAPAAAPPKPAAAPGVAKPEPAAPSVTARPLDIRAVLRKADGEDIGVGDGKRIAVRPAGLRRASFDTMPVWFQDDATGQRADAPAAFMAALVAAEHTNLVTIAKGKVSLTDAGRERLAHHRAQETAAPPSKPAADAAAGGPRFADLAAVQAHLSASNDQARRGVGKDKTLVLSDGGRLVARKQVNWGRWEIYTTQGTLVAKLTPTTDGGPDRDAAVGLMNRLEVDPRFDGVDWDAPGLQHLSGSPWRSSDGKTLDVGMRRYVRDFEAGKLPEPAPHRAGAALVAERAAAPAGPSVRVEPVVASQPGLDRGGAPNGNVEVQLAGSPDPDDRALAEDLRAGRRDDLISSRGGTLFAWPNRGKTRWEIRDGGDGHLVRVLPPSVTTRDRGVVSARLDELEQEQEGAGREPVRRAGDEALPGVSARPVGADSGGRPGGVLRSTGPGGRQPDRGADAGVRRPGPAGRDVPGQAGAAGDRGAAGPGAGDGGTGAARPGPAGGPGDTGGRPAPGPVRVDAAGAGPGRRAGRGKQPAAGAGPAPGRAGADQPTSPDGRRPERHPVSDPGAPPPRFRPTGRGDAAPGGAKAKARANIEAIKVLRDLEAGNRHATADEQRTLARWSSWGSIPKMFTEGEHEFDAERAELRTLMNDAEWAEARRTTLNAHYTDPGIAKAMWEALVDAGFDGGRVLEPGSGAGTFIGVNPQYMDIQMTGVELDSTTARISAALYPDAAIRSESFADTRMPAGAFDAAIGNVPFSDAKLHDPRHNAANLSMHNHFISKALDLTKDGGVVMMLSSRYTMDASGPKARRELAARADFLGAVRLPSGSHRSVAGTDVIEDILVFRKRPEGEPARGQAWDQSRPTAYGEYTLPTNQYFVDHPEQVVGNPHAESGQYGTGSLIVDAPADTTAGVRAALARVVAQAHADGLGAEPRDPETDTTAMEPKYAPAGHGEGHLEPSDETFTRVVTHGADGKPLAKPRTETTQFTTVVDGLVVPFWDVDKSSQAELADLLGMRDQALALLDAESTAGVDDTAELDRLRADLNIRYDAYAAAYGPVNRFKWRDTGRFKKVLDPAGSGEMVPGDEKVMSQLRPSRGGFADDPQSVVVDALEKYDPITQTATKTDIMSRRVVAPRELPTSADTPGDALNVTFERYGQVRLDEIGRLLGVDQAEARRRLGTAVFDVPGPADADGRHSVAGHVVAAEYLSGNVRAKLRDAQAAAATDPGFAPNVDALRAVIPADLGPERIRVRLGQPWIAAPHVQAFLKQLLGDYTLTVTHDKVDGWKVKGDRQSDLSRREYGTAARAATQLAQSLLNQSTIKVEDTVEVDGKEKKVPNLDATVAAQAKADEIQERFADWLWTDPVRADALTAIYNDRYNSHVLRSYKGATRTMPGLSTRYAPHPHQFEAVDRAVNEPAAGLFHSVGAGKTLEMAMIAMELRRLGMSRKPAIVVPNHMLKQFTREFLEAYPQARILAAGSDDMKGKKRRAFVARAATGDWDAVIMTQEAFQRTSVSDAARQAYMDDQTALLRDKLQAAEAAAADNPGSKKAAATAKGVERRMLKAEEALKKRLSHATDNAVSFEQTGIDYLMIDEAHHYKNLAITSSIEGVSIEGSSQASDLDMKLHYLRATTESGRVVTFATGTPLANTVAEAYTMTKFLRPDLLEEAGIADFDDWAASYGEIVIATEMSPDGNSFRQKARFARFQNLRGLLLQFHTFADVKLAKDLGLKLPEQSYADPNTGQAVVGRPRTLLTPRSEAQAAYIRELGQRAEEIRSGSPRTFPSPTPDNPNNEIEDNMLKVSGDGRRAAVDLRLVGLTDPEDPNGERGKLADVAADLARGYTATKDDQYPIDPKRPDLGLHPTKGSLQFVFLDQGTPTGKSWNAYQDLKDKLVARGVPAAKIRFIHDAKSDVDKEQLFAAARSGDVAVLIGSTEKMGTGVNAQYRATHLYHVDVPWRPADMEQREGRILRQGNANPTVEIVRAATEATFDAYSYQTVERKARGINGLLEANLDADEVADIGDSALSYAEMKAIVSGNPLLIEQSDLDAAVTKLARLERAFNRNQATLKTSIPLLTRRLSAADTEVAAYEAALARRVDTTGDLFRLTTGDAEYAKRADAGKALGETIKDKVSYSSVIVGQVGGFDITARRYYSEVQRAYVYGISVDGIPNSESTWSAAAMESATGQSDMVARLESAIKRSGFRLNVAADEQRGLQAKVNYAQANVGRTYAKTDLLRAGERRKKLLDRYITMGGGNPAAEAGLSEDMRADLGLLRGQMDLLPSVDAIAAGRADRTGDLPAAPPDLTPEAAAPDRLPEQSPTPPVVPAAPEPERPPTAADAALPGAVGYSPDPGRDGTSVLAGGDRLGDVIPEGDGTWSYETASGGHAGVDEPSRDEAVIGLGRAAAVEAAQAAAVAPARRATAEDQDPGPAVTQDFSGGWARPGPDGRPDEFSVYTRPDGSAVHAYVGPGGAVRIYDETGQQLAEFSDVGRAVVYVLGQGWTVPGGLDLPAPSRAGVPPRPAAPDGVLNVLHGVAGRGDDGVGGVSQIGLNPRALALALERGYVERSDTGDPNTDGGRFRLRLTDAGRGQVVADDEYRRATVSPLGGVVAGAGQGVYAGGAAGGAGRGGTEPPMPAVATAPPAPRVWPDAQTEPVVYAHRADWDGQVVPGDGPDDWAVWNTHRPLSGTTTWQGQSRYGVFYAAMRRSDPNFAATAERNSRDDAREVLVVNNAQVREALEQQLAGGGYSLQDYAAADIPVGEVAAMRGLPWSDTDTSGDTPAQPASDAVDMVGLADAARAVTSTAPPAPTLSEDVVREALDRAARMQTFDAVVPQVLRDELVARGWVTVEQDGTITRVSLTEAGGRVLRDGATPAAAPTPPAPAVTAGFTQRDVGTVIGDELTRQGLEWRAGLVGEGARTGPGFVIGGREFTPKQAADRYYPGGWDAAWTARGGEPAGTLEPWQRTPEAQAARAQIAERQAAAAPAAAAEPATDDPLAGFSTTEQESIRQAVRNATRAVPEGFIATVASAVAGLEEQHGRGGTRAAIAAWVDQHPEDVPARYRKTAAERARAVLEYRRELIAAGQWSPVGPIPDAVPPAPAAAPVAPPAAGDAVHDSAAGALDNVAASAGTYAVGGEVRRIQDDLARMRAQQPPPSAADWAAWYATNRDVLTSQGVGVPSLLVRARVAAAASAFNEATKRWAAQAAQAVPAPAAAPTAASEAPRAPGWVGEPGQRVTNLLATVTAVRPMRTSRGQRTLVTLATPGGDALKWFAPGEAHVEDDWSVGDRVELSGSVDKHDEFRGKKETLLDNVALALPGAPPPVPGSPAAEEISGEDVAVPAPADVTAPDVAAGEGDIGRGITYRNYDHGLVLDGETWSAKQDIGSDGFGAAGFAWRAVPGAGTDAKGRPVKKWTAYGDDAARQAAIGKLRAALGIDVGGAFPPTPEQQAVVDAVGTGDDVVVRALAGTGKTTTLKLIALQYPDQRFLYVAFNKTVQEQAQGSMPGNVEARTDSSLSFTSMSDAVKERYRNKRKAVQRADLVAAHLRITGALPAGQGEPPLTPAEQATAVLRAVDAYSISADDAIGPQHLPERARPAAAALLPYARAAWADLNSDTGLLQVTNTRITKMWALTRPDLSQRGSGVRTPASVILMDEAQDTNPVLAKVIGDQTIQVIWVGDGNQAIYGFRGATDQLDKVQVTHDLPLTKSWRFGPEVAEVGNRWLQLLDSPYRVEGGGAPSRILPPGTMTNPDAVIVRSNAGAIGEILALQGGGRTVGVPKGTKADLRKLVNTTRWLQAVSDAEKRGGQPGVPMPEALHDDLSAFRNWREVVAEEEKGDDPKLSMLVRIVTDHTLAELDALVDDLVDAGDNTDTRPVDTVVTTAHKAKGAEWDRVEIGEDFRGPRVNKATGETVMPEPEELRLAYVAVTRAKKDLDPGSLDWVNNYTDPNGGAPAAAADQQAQAAADGLSAQAVPAGFQPATDKARFGHFNTAEAEWRWVDGPPRAGDVVRLRRGRNTYHNAVVEGPSPYGADVAVRFPGTGERRGINPEDLVAWQPAAAAAAPTATDGPPQADPPAAAPAAPDVAGDAAARQALNSLSTAVFHAAAGQRGPRMVASTHLDAADRAADDADREQHLRIAAEALHYEGDGAGDRGLVDQIQDVRRRFGLEPVAFPRDRAGMPAADLSLRGAAALNDLFRRGRSDNPGMVEVAERAREWTATGRTNGSTEAWLRADPDAEQVGDFAERLVATQNGTVNDTWDVLRAMQQEIAAAEADGRDWQPGTAPEPATGPDTGAQRPVQWPGHALRGDLVLADDAGRLREWLPATGGRLLKRTVSRTAQPVDIRPGGQILVGGPGGPERVTVVRSTVAGAALNDFDFDLRWPDGHTQTSRVAGDTSLQVVYDNYTAEPRKGLGRVDAARDEILALPTDSGIGAYRSSVTRVAKLYELSPVQAADVRDAIRDAKRAATGDRAGYLDDARATVDRYFHDLTVRGPVSVPVTVPDLREPPGGALAAEPSQAVPAAGVLGDRPVADLTDADIAAEVEALNARQYGGEFAGRPNMMVDPDFQALVARRTALTDEQTRRTRAAYVAGRDAAEQAARDALLARTGTSRTALADGSRLVFLDGEQVGTVSSYRGGRGGWTYDMADGTSAAEVFPTQRAAVLALARMVDARAERQQEQTDRWDAPPGTTPVTAADLAEGDRISLPPHDRGEQVTVAGVETYANGGGTITYRRGDGTAGVWTVTPSGRGQIGRYDKPADTPAAPGEAQPTAPPAAEPARQVTTGPPPPPGFRLAQLARGGEVYAVRANGRVLADGAASYDAHRWVTTRRAYTATPTGRYSETQLQFLDAPATAGPSTAAAAARHQPGDVVRGDVGNGVEDLTIEQQAPGSPDLWDVRTADGQAGTVGESDIVAPAVPAAADAPAPAVPAAAGAGEVPELATYRDAAQFIAEQTGLAGDPQAVADLQTALRPDRSYIHIDLRAPLEQRGGDKLTAMLAIAEAGIRGERHRRYNPGQVRDGLQRYLNDDPTLPATSVGHRVQITVLDRDAPIRIGRPAARTPFEGVVDRVVDSSPTSRVQVIVVGDDGTTESEIMPADARLTVLDGPAPAGPGQPDLAAARLEAVRGRWLAGAGDTDPVGRRSIANTARNPTFALSPGGGLAYWRKPDGTWEYASAGNAISFGRDGQLDSTWGGAAEAAALAAAYETQVVDAAGQPVRWADPDLSAVGRTWRSDRGETLIAAMARVKREHDAAAPSDVGAQLTMGGPAEPIRPDRAPAPPATAAPAGTQLSLMPEPTAYGDQDMFAAAADDAAAEADRPDVQAIVDRYRLGDLAARPAPDLVTPPYAEIADLNDALHLLGRLDPPAPALTAAVRDRQQTLAAAQRLMDEEEAAGIRRLDGGGRIVATAWERPGGKPGYRGEPTRYDVQDPAGAVIGAVERREYDTGPLWVPDRGTGRPWGGREARNAVGAVALLRAALADAPAREAAAERRRQHRESVDARDRRAAALAATRDTPAWGLAVGDRIMVPDALTGEPAPARITSTDAGAGTVHIGYTWPDGQQDTMTVAADDRLPKVVGRQPDVVDVDRVTAPAPAAEARPGDRVLLPDGAGSAEPAVVAAVTPEAGRPGAVRVDAERPDGTETAAVLDAGSPLPHVTPDTAPPAYVDGGGRPLAAGDKVRFARASTSGVGGGGADWTVTDLWPDGTVGLRNDYSNAGRGPATRSSVDPARLRLTGPAVPPAADVPDPVPVVDDPVPPETPPAPRPPRVRGRSRTPAERAARAKDRRTPRPDRPDLPAAAATVAEVAPGDRIADTGGGELTIIGIRRDSATGHRVLSLVDEAGYRTTLAADDRAQVGVTTRAAAPVPLPDGVASARPAVATYQRRAVIALDLEGSGDAALAQAAARVRARAPLSAAQARALTAELGRLAAADDRPAKQRSLSRLAAQVGAAAQLLDGQLAPEAQRREGVVRGRVADVTEGDTVAVVAVDGTPTVGRVVGRRRILSGRLTEITVQRGDGDTSRHMLSANAPIYLMPDLTPPTPVDDPAMDGQPLEAAAGRVTAGQVDEGDRITAHGVTGVVTGITAYTGDDGLPAADLTLDTGDTGPGGQPLAVQVTLSGADTAQLAAPPAGGPRAAAAVAAAEQAADVHRQAAALRTQVGAAAARAVTDGLWLTADQAGPADLAAGRAALTATLRSDETRLRAVDAPIGGDAMTAVIAAIAPHLDSGQRAGLEPQATALIRAARRDFYDRVLAGFDDWPETGPAGPWRAGHALKMVMAATGREGPAEAGRYETVVRAAAGLDPLPGPTALPPQPAAPAAGDLAEQVAALRAALPADTADLGMRRYRGQTFAAVDLAALDVGQAPDVVDAEFVGEDKADDGGPGQTAARHLAVIRAAGRLVDDRVRTREDEIVAAAGDAGTLGNRFVRSRARAQAAAEVLTQIRPMGPAAPAGALPLSPKSGKLADGMRWAERVFPRDWLGRAAAEPEPIRLKRAERGSHRDHQGTTLIELSPRPGMNHDGGDYGEVGVHETAHHMEQVVPGLVAAERAFMWDRTSTGPVGARDRTALTALPGHDDEYTRDGGFPEPYTGREYGPGHREAYELLSTGMQGLFAGANYLDDDLRQWTLGVLALLGEPPGGGRGRPARAAAAKPVNAVTTAPAPSAPSPAVAVPADLSGLTSDELRALMRRTGVAADPDLLARIQDEINRRQQPLAGMSDDDLAALLNDPATAADPARLDQVMAELARRDAADPGPADLTPAEEAQAADWQTRMLGVDTRAAAAGLPDDLVHPGRAGLTATQRQRRDYEEWLGMQMVAAEQATRGNLLSKEGAAAGVSPYDLFTGDAARSVRYAAEELIAWWTEDNTRRMSWPEWRAAATGGRSAAARRSRDRFVKALQLWETGRPRRGRKSADGAEEDDDA